jgi:hypothetical protein
VAGQKVPPPEQTKQTPGALGSLQKAEIEKRRPMIKEADIKASKIYKLYQLFNADLRVLVERTKPAI